MHNHDLLQAIERGAWVLTPNQRLSVFCQEQFQQNRKQSANTVWARAPIMPLERFIDEQWQQLMSQVSLPLPQVLAPEAQSWRWQQIVAKQASSLLNLEGTAQTVAKAWRLCHEWQIDWQAKVPGSASSDDAWSAFQGFAKAFHRENQAGHFISQVERLDYLRTQLADRTLTLNLPDEIILLGFQECHPQLAALLSVYEQQSVRFTRMQLASDDSCVRVRAYADPKQEITEMARWAAQQIANGATRIACVVPDLAGRRDEVVASVTQVLKDESLFECSQGIPLSQIPVVQTALLIFNCLRHQSQASDLLSLLSSPYWHGFVRERSQRARLRLSLYEASNLNRRSAFKLLASLSSTQDMLTALETVSAKKKQSPSQWIQDFRDCLVGAGWPGERLLASEEFQCVERFKQVLMQCRQFEQVSSQFTLTDMLRALKQTIDGVIFQPKRERAPIQVLGLLEASGLTFDATWIAGLTADVWPPPARANPYIPLALQKARMMPHASAAREMMFSKQLTQQFAQSGRDVIFSYASWDDDREQRLSPLLSSWASDEEQPPLPVPAAHAPAPMEALSETLGPSFQAVDTETLRGGAALFRDQAACPFQAFAKWRLQVDTVGEPSLGPDAIERGIITHHILEMLWTQLTDQASLLALDDAALTALLTPMIEQALQDAQIAKTWWPLEKQRLAQQIKVWLEAEKARPPFKVVAQEATQTQSIEGLNIRLRIDRIDALADGTRLLIDYKTGKPHISAWFQERLSEPQLPLYALSMSDVGAMAFAQIRADGVGFKGVAEDETGIEGIGALAGCRYSEADTWSVQRAAWQQQCEALAREFKAGVAAVSPKDPSVCAFCQYDALCRI
jgi:ATP-dependent helicase/nuclease subunit B